MNRVHRTVWNHRRQAYMVAAENTSSAGSRSSSTATLLASVLAGAVLASSAQAAAPPAATLPTGAVVTAGQATVAQQGSTMTVTQGSAKAAIEWDKFSIGKDSTVVFIQPDATAVALNRVTGQEGSVIDGALHANGQVFILNPNGVLFGKGAQVDTAGLVASTLALSDADFLAGKTTFNGKGGSVTNLGSLNAHDGGYVALLGGQVSNTGLVSARLGTVVLAAGNKISLQFSGDSLVGVVVDEAALNALVANGQAIHADGGLVILTAKAADGLLDVVVNNTGEVRAQTIDNKAGHIFLLGAGGAVEVGGKLDAGAPQGGDGGAIETSGATLRVADGTQVSTASMHGSSGTWLIDPTDFTVSSGSAAQSASGMGAATLQTALAAGNVTIQTQAAGTETGNINVNAPVAWNANKLTLEAYGDINVNAVMSATGTSTLDLKTGYNFNTGAPSFDTTKQVLMGGAGNGSFTGRIDFDRSGTNILTINNDNYSLVNALGAANSTSATELQGIGNASSGNYALANNIDAATTSTWNSGAGFTPLSLSGIFDGLGHTVANLTINQPSGTYVGLFGTPNGLLRNVGLTNASVTGNQGVGTLAGMTMGSVYNSFAASSTVYAPGGYGGGLIGAIFSNTVVDTHVISGSITSAGNNVGGLAGYLAYQVPLNDSSSSMTVINTAGQWTGGLVGQNDYGYINNSHASGSVTGRIETGGLVGNNNSGIITGSYATGAVSGTSNTGGLVGNDNNGRVAGSYATGTVSGTTSVGGLIGLSVAAGGNPTSGNEINTSYSTGTVTASGDNSGGLIGENYGNNVADAYSRSAVHSTGNYVGGLIGNNLGSAENTYSTGAVTSTGAGVGGLMGVSIGGVSNSFWDTQTSGQNSSMDGTGKTTADMKVSTLFSNSGWDFTFHTGVWGRKDSVNDGYPVLRTFGYTDPLTITLNNAALDKSYGAANPTLGASGWTVSGCGNVSCISSVDWGSAIAPTSAVGSYNYNAANVLAVSLASGYGKLSDYDITIASGALTINKAVLSVTGTSAVARPYDGTTAAAITAGTLSGLANGETLNLSATGSFDSADAGSRTASATLSLANGTGANAGLASNYQLASTVVNGLASTISPLAVTLAATSSKPYDATSTVGGALLHVTNAVNGDTVAVSGNATLAGANAGSQAVTDLSGLSLASSNYTLVGASAGAVTITPLTLGVQAAGGATRVYDGQASATASLLTLSGALAGDSVSISGGGATLAGKNVGTQALTGVGTLVLDNGNYTLTGASVSGNVAVTALPVNVAAVSGATRVYDGGTDAAANLMHVTNAVSGDTVTLGGNAALTAKDVGARGIANLGGLTLSDSNYTLTGATLSGTVSVTPKVLGLTVTPGATRHYDGTAGVASDMLGVTGAVTGDSVAINGGSATLASKNVGTQSLTGAGTLSLDNGNYTLSGGPLGGTLAITALPVELGGLATKIYDGTASVNASQLVIANAISGDVVALGGSATLDSKNAGVRTIGNFSGLTLNDSNYTLTGASGGLTVAPKPLDVNVQQTSRSYDGTSLANASLLAVSGTVGGDSVTLSGNGTLSGQNVGVRALTGLSGLSVSDANYTLVGGVPSGAVTINPLLVSLVTAPGASRVYDGSAVADPSLLRPVGILSGDSATLSGNVTLASGNVGAQSITGVSGLSLNNANYMLADIAPAGTVQITPLSLSLSARGGATRVYDGGTGADATLLQLGGMLDGDSVSLSGKAALAAKDVGSQAISGLGSLILSNDNYTLAGVTPSGSVAITPRAVSVAPQAGATRIYDGGTGASASLLQVNGVLAGDSVGLSGNAVLASKNVGAQAITSLSGLVLGNANYTLAGAVPDGSIAIAARPLDVVVQSGATRVYDGSTTAAAGLLALNGVLAGDSVALAGSGMLAAKDAGNEALVGVSGLSVSNSNYTVAGGKPGGTLSVTARPLAISTVDGAAKVFDGTTAASSGLFQLDGLLSGDRATLAGNATLSGIMGNVTVASLNGITLSNGNYTLAGASASGTVAIMAGLQETGNDTVSQAVRAQAPDTDTAAQVAAPLFAPMKPNVDSAPPVLTAAFGAGVPLNLISSPGAGERAESVTLEQARHMVNPGQAGSGQREVRVPVSRNSMAEIVNGGVKLPGGVDQLLFVVKGN